MPLSWTTVTDHNADEFEALIADGANNGDGAAWVFFDKPSTFGEAILGEVKLVTGLTLLEDGTLGKRISNGPADEHAE